jgi:hypothetical protein
MRAKGSTIGSGLAAEKDGLGLVAVDYYVLFKASNKSEKYCACWAFYSLW